MRVPALVLTGILSVGIFAGSAHAQQDDVKEVLSELANSMGMLRGTQQEDSILTLEHWMKGTMTAGTQRFDVPEYRISINYSVPGMRVDYRRQTQRMVEVVSGATAWNEAERGKNPTPARDKVKERLVYLWTTPMGIVKAAHAAGAKATMKADGDTKVLSFPLPPPADDVTVRATVRRDASLVIPHETALKNLVGTYIVRVETTGTVVTDTTYAEYGDWNWDDYKADIMLPRRITRKQGDTTLDLVTVNTNTYNPYVVMPVPESIK
jgi:hypothetical protein